MLGPRLRRLATAEKSRDVTGQFRQVAEHELSLSGDARGREHAQAVTVVRRPPGEPFRGSGKAKVEFPALRRRQSAPGSQSADRLVQS